MALGPASSVPADFPPGSGPYVNRTRQEQCHEYPRTPHHRIQRGRITNGLGRSAGIEHSAIGVCKCTGAFG